MDTPVLEASERNSSIKAKTIRLSSRLPAVYYGRGRPALSLSLDYQSFRKVFEKAGQNTIIELSVDGAKNPVLVHDVQFDPVSDQISHVDFMHVDMTKEVTTSVKVVIIGVAPAVKNLGGILDIQKHDIKIKCLPKDLIHEIQVDVSSIVDYHTSIHVKDLKIPPAIKILDRPDDTVVTVVPPKIEEEAPKPSEATAVQLEGTPPPVPGTPAGTPAPPAGTPTQASQKEAKK